MLAESVLPNVEVEFVGCVVDVPAPNRDVLGAGWEVVVEGPPNKPVEGAEGAVAAAVPNRPVEGADVAVVLPNRPVDGAEVVVVVFPNEKDGADVFAGPPTRLNNPPDAPAVVVVVLVLRLGKLKDWDVCCCEVEASKIDFRFPCASVLGVLKFRPPKVLLEPP